MSKISRNGNYVRPAWNYFPDKTSSTTNLFSVLEMLESVRNVCEQVRDEIKGLRLDLKAQKRRRP